MPSIYLKIPGVSRSLVPFLTFCNRTANFTATIMLEFSGVQQGIDVFVSENSYLFFPLHLALLVPAINLTAESRLGSNWNSD